MSDASGSSGTTATFDVFLVDLTAVPGRRFLGQVGFEPYAGSPVDALVAMAWKDEPEAFEDATVEWEEGPQFNCRVVLGGQTFELKMEVHR